MSTKEKVLELHKQGFSYNEISKQLNISKGTISFHIKNKKTSIAKIKHRTCIEKRVDVTCLECNKSFTKKKRDYEYTAKDFCCNQCFGFWTNKNRPKKIKIKSKPVEKKDIFCIVCNTKLSGLQVKFCSTKCKNKKHQGNSVEAQQARGLKRKLRFIQEKGGKCQNCGYNKNIGALSFHHRDPNEKSFGLDMRTLSNNSMKKLQEEADKCDLLCMNCHMEHHNPKLEQKQ